MGVQMLAVTSKKSAWNLGIRFGHDSLDALGLEQVIYAL